MSVEELDLLEYRVLDDDARNSFALEEVLRVKLERASSYRVRMHVRIYYRVAREKHQS